MDSARWMTLADKGGEYHSAHHRGLFLEVSRAAGRAEVVGVVFTGAKDGEYEKLERFTAQCTIDDAKARVLRVANRHLDTVDIV